MRRRARTTDVEEREEEEEMEEIGERDEREEEEGIRFDKVPNRPAEHAAMDGGGTRDFRTLMIDERIVKGLEAAGYIRPSPVQLRAIPLGNVNPFVAVAGL
eukprot:754762-Hanusia_phi.AAC.8